MEREEGEGGGRGRREREDGEGGGRGRREREEGEGDAVFRSSSVIINSIL